MLRYRHNSTFRVREDAAKPSQLRRARFTARSGRVGKLRVAKQAVKKVWIGPKTRAWRNCVVRLKKKYAHMGITSCELRYQGCWHDDALGFAHGRKRRWLGEDELEKLTILVCNPCHDKIEFLLPEEMLKVVQDVIAGREVTA